MQYLSTQHLLTFCSPPTQQGEWEKGSGRGREEMSKAGSFLWNLKNKSQLLSKLDYKH